MTTTTKMICDLMDYVEEMQISDLVSPSHVRRAQRLAKILGVTLADLVQSA